MSVTLLLFLATLGPAAEARSTGPTVTRAESSVAVDGGVKVAPAMPAPKPGEFGLTGPSTGVTCTIRILPADTGVDRGILGPRPQPQSLADPIVRNDLSPCLK